MNITTTKLTKKLIPYCQGQFDMLQKIVPKLKCQPLGGKYGKRLDVSQSFDSDYDSDTDSDDYNYYDRMKPKKKR